MKHKRIFVSGGAGVIGREMISKLVAKGMTVMAGDLKPKPIEFPVGVIYQQGDLNYMTQSEMDAFSPDVFIHLAATFERSTESLEFWDENFWHNLRLSHHLMSLVKNTDSVKRVVFASSYLIYDPVLYQFDVPQDNPVSLKESDPILPRNLTGMAKLAHEMELRFIEQFYSSQFSTVCARIYRGYGRNSRDVISRWIRMLLQGEPITVYRPEGMFDFIYAADTAEGLIRLSEIVDVTGIINLGTGHARRVQEVVDILSTHFPNIQQLLSNSDLPFEASQANMTSFQTMVGWVPEYDLEQAIPEMIAFERNRNNSTDNQYRPIKVLVSSASQKVPLVRAMQAAVKRISPGAQVVAGDLDSQALAAFVADEFWAMPCTNEGSVKSIVDGCVQRGISCVLPTRDGELSFWAKHAPEFEVAGISVIVSSVASLELCLDKLEFAHFGKKNGLPFIPTVQSPDDFDAAHWVVKERFGAGSKSLGLNLGKAAALSHGRLLEAPIYQQYIEGMEISIDAWLDRQRRVKGVVLRRREYIVNGESRVTATFRDARIESEAKRILEMLHLAGPVVMQIIIDEKGGMHVIECNARFGGASTTGIAAGLDSLYWSLLEAQGNTVDDYPFLRLPHEIRQVRILGDIYVDSSGV